MGLQADWVTLDESKDVETRIEPVTDPDTGTILSYNRSYRTVTTKVEMETFTELTSFSPVVGVPVTGVATVISDSYRTTCKETNSGEHTKTTQTISAWASF
jgi:hypothetical protein